MHVHFTRVADGSRAMIRRSVMVMLVAAGAAVGTVAAPRPEVAVRRALRVTKLAKLWEDICRS